MEATSAASATRRASATCAAEPAPPEAITGIGDGVAHGRGEFEVEARSLPVLADRGEQDLPGAARSTPRRAHATVGVVVATRPPWVWTTPSPASIATTTA